MVRFIKLRYVSDNQETRDIVINIQTVHLIVEEFQPNVFTIDDQTFEFDSESANVLRQIFFQKAEYNVA